MESRHEFVIVGGGLAGLVVAARLTEDPNTSVLVLEAGGNHTTDPRVRTPGLWPSLLGSDFYWDFRSTPQKGLDGKIIPLSQGKLLGGSSAINGQAFVANSKSAIDAWAQFGNPSWDWKTLAPYFKKCHTLSRPSPAACDHLRLNYIDDTVRGTDGPVQASFPETDDPLPAAWVDTLAALGYPASGDPFSGELVGGYINAMNIDPTSGTRSDAVTAYYEPAKDRPNLHVVTDVVVEKIVFAKSGTMPKAIGVQVQRDGHSLVVEATKEVILAAGVFGTPKLLELSGVGLRERLEPLGIPVVVDNANVGENLQDHPNVGVSFEVADGVKTMDDLSRQDSEAIAAAMGEYVTKKTGPFAVGGNFAGSMLPVIDFVDGPESESTLKSALDASDDATPGLFSPYHASFVHSLLGRRSEGTGNFFTYAACGNFMPEGSGASIIENASSAGNFITIVVALLFPLSRGSVHIISADPAGKPSIDPRYLEHPLDLEVLARHLRFIDTIVRTEPLSRYLKSNGRRSNGAPEDLRDLKQAKEYTKTAALSCYHPTSSCAMLPRERGGVVDPKLCVYGVEGLRVVDSSIFPIVPEFYEGYCVGFFF
ncbi:glucose-methanol-choline oxidoreductase-like protein [Hypoxylon fuscum]|nr:glucose-methanol-choline oxidoreductase-like protein [Hypoxylon fuscum]